MAKIDLKSAYDEFTQEDLFRQVCEENIGDADEYDRDQIETDKRQFGCWKSVTEMAQDLLKMYQSRWQNKVDSIDDTLNYYVTVDYSSMLQDDLFTGYFDLLKCSNGTYVLYMTPEGAKKSHLTTNSQQLMWQNHD